MNRYHVLLFLQFDFATTETSLDLKQQRCLLNDLVPIFYAVQLEICFVPKEQFKKNKLNNSCSNILITFFNILRYNNIPTSTVAAVEISDRKDLNTLYKFRNLISVNRIFIKDYKINISI
jgi:hypothetical protein